MNYEFSNLLKWDSETVMRQIAFIPLTVKERILEQLSVTGTEYETWNITSIFFTYRQRGVLGVFFMCFCKGTRENDILDYTDKFWYLSSTALYLKLICAGSNEIKLTFVRQKESICRVRHFLRQCKYTAVILLFKFKCSWDWYSLVLCSQIFLPCSSWVKVSATQ